VTTPPASSVGSVSDLHQVQAAALPIANATAIPKLLNSVTVHPEVNLSSHGVGGHSNYSA